MPLSRTDAPVQWRALDGLRALAVASVLLFHTSMPLFQNGFVGVDVFFVLSGFLITRILLAEHASTARVSLPGFYGRRMLRLYPALVLLVSTSMAVAVLAHRRVADVASGGLSALAYVSNAWIFSGHDTYLLQHTWTLGVEMQFYVLWPLILVGILSGWRLRWCALGVVLATAALLLAPGLPFTVVRGALVASFARGSGLVAGCALGWLTASNRWRSGALRGAFPATILPACLALLALLMLSGLLVTRAPFEAPFNPAVMLTIPLVMLVVSGVGGPGEALLSAAPLTWLGRRSYGVYLYHFPLLSMSLHQLPQRVPLPVRAAAAIIATLVVAAISYRFVESPFLRMKARLKPAREGVPSQ